MRDQRITIQPGHSQSLQFARQISHEQEFEKSMFNTITNGSIIQTPLVSLFFYQLSLCLFQIHIKSNIFAKVKMYLQSSEDERELGWNWQHNKSIFSNRYFQECAAKISPRLRSIYDQLSQIFSQRTQINKSPDFQDKILQISSTLTFNHDSTGGPICNRQIKGRGFLCFDCNLQAKNHSIYCEECFEYSTHKDHYFTVFEDMNGLCDCGNEKIIKQESFCPKHKNFKSQALPFNKQAQQYLKQLEFIFYILFAIKGQKSEEVQKHEILWQCVLEIINKTIKESYMYQLKTSELMIKSFSEEYKNDQRPIIEIIFTEKWSLKNLKSFCQIYLALYPVKIARKKILLELIKIFNAPFESCDTLRILKKLFCQYGYMENILVKLFKKKIVKPIASYMPRQQLSDAFDYHTLIFEFYQLIEANHLYPQIIEAVLSSTPINCFFNLPLENVQEDELKKYKTTFECLYARTMMEFIKALVKTPTSKEILKKIIRQCYQIVIEKEENTLLSAEKTLGVCIFAYFDYDFQNLACLSLDEVYQFLSPSVPLKSLKSQLFLNRLANLLAKFQRQVIIEQYSILPGKTFTSINHSFIKFITLFIVAIDNNVEKSIIHLSINDNEQISIDSIEVFDNTSCFEVLIKTQMTNCANILSRCHQYLSGDVPPTLGTQLEFVQNLQKIYSKGIKINLLIWCFLGAFEGDTSQIILANQFSHPDKKKIIDFYSELALLHQQQPIKQFKATAEQWIKNEEILETFLKNNYEQIRLKDLNSPDLEYSSNISFYSEFAGNSFEQQNAIRLKLKVCSDAHKPKKWGKVLNIFFNDETSDRLLDYFKPIVQCFCSKKVAENVSALQYLRFTIMLLIDLYLETRRKRIKDFMYEIQGKIESDTELNDLLTRILSIIQEQDTHKKNKNFAQISQQTQQFKKLAKQKKLKVLKNIKEKQAKILAQKHEAPESDTNQNICIICRQSSSKEPLYFLSKVNISNVLNFLLLRNKDPIFVFWTCGHKIHQSCLSRNLAENNQYASNYRCFLCQQRSNFRIPISRSLSNREVNNFYEQFLTISKLEMDNNQHIQKYHPIDGDMSASLARSIAAMTYLYSTCCKKMFNSRMLPLLDPLLFVLKMTLKHQANRVLSMKRTPNNAEFNSVIQIFEQIINNCPASPLSLSLSIMHQLEEKKLHTHLTSAIDSYQRTPYSQDNNLIFNLFKLPEDLYEISFKSRYCGSCHKLYSNMSTCLFCGIALCQNCKEFAQKHREECHLGTIITVNNLSGDVRYQNSRGAIVDGNLYKNYVGQSYTPENFKRPKKNNFLLDTKTHQKIQQNIFLENVNGIIESKLAAQNLNNCQIQ